MAKTKLTEEQKEYAEGHHGLVYAFLNRLGLDADEFYDVVVFGYLNAVMEYLRKPDLRKAYAFSTVAFRKMKDALSKNRAMLNRRKRKAVTVDLDSVWFTDKVSPALQQAMLQADPTTIEFEMDRLMRDLEARLPKEKMEVIRMKVAGYKPREIAKTRKIGIQGVNRILADLKDTIMAVCYKED